MSKFTPQDLSDCFNAGRSDQDAALPWHPGLSSQFDAMPSGEQTAWGIPFKFSPHAPRWVVSGHDRTPAVLPLHGTANYVVIAHFCNASQRPTEGPTGVDWGAVTQPGEHLADYVLIYDDGSVHRVPIRRRYEINQPNVPWGHLAFAAAPYHQPKPVKLLEPEPEAGLWGLVQTGVWTTDGGYWLYALANPHPDKPLKEMRIEPTGADLLAVAGVTLFTGDVHPLRHERLESFRVKLPAREAVAPADLDIDIDLGIIARVRDVPPFAPDAWLAAEVQGWGEPHTSGQPKDTHILDIAASRAAALRIAGREVPMEDLFQPQGKVASADGQVSAEVLGYEKTWLRVTVEDEQGRPTPVRVHFRAPDGRYLPPYGHRHEVNPCWFEDYGADSKLGGTAYAYVPGTFEIELPVGEVYVEIAKGFEYAPLRRRLAIAPGQRELTLRLERPIDLRRAGWVTADTHVHFISPTTAWLEAAGEGLNLLNLLASQWGDLFTNVGDITGAPVSHDDVMVWVGTENRQHILGHMSLLGVKGAPINPMTTGGPNESYIGDPVMVSMAEWADRCRAQEGVVVLPHFPNPLCEAAADIVLGKIDGVEIRDFGQGIDTFAVNEWYRYLNLGYRVAAVGGTDKMFAGMPPGGVRTYAHLLPGDDFTFENWGKAVRAGRTFTTSGPLLLLDVSGHEPGAVIDLPGAGAVHAAVHARSMAPFHLLEIVANGTVVARQTFDEGTQEAELEADIAIERSGWVAARCLSHHTVWHVWPVRAAAHTSPVYVDVAGSPRPFNAKDARYLLAILRGGLLWLETLAIPYAAETHAKITGVFERAVHELETRLSETQE